jgi:hypothetical protein
MQRDKSSDGSVVGSLDFGREEACRQLAVGFVIAYALATFAFHAARISARTVFQVNLSIWAFLPHNSPLLSYQFLEKE